MSAQVEYIKFSVHGDYITDLLRNIFLEEGYQKVYDMFNKTFTSQLDVQHLNNILICKNKFSGINEFDYVEDSWEENSKYKEDFDFRFAGLVYHNKRYYKPYALITGWVQKDFSYAASVWRDRSRIDSWDEPCYFAPLKRECSFNEIRSYYYVKDQGKKYEILTHNHEVYIFEEIDFDVPYWMCDQFKRSFKNALIEYLNKKRYLTVINPIKELKEAEQFSKNTESKYNEETKEKSTNDFFDENKEVREKFARNAVLKSYKERILKQNEDKWVDLIYVVNGEERLIKVPAKPFHHWCIGSGRLMEVPNYEKLLKKIDYWVPCSPPGIKMGNDNTYHTDWIIGMGLDPEDWYYNTEHNEEYKAIDDAAWKYSFDFVLELTKKKRKK